jgi:hypothetical protein
MCSVLNAASVKLASIHAAVSEHADTWSVFWSSCIVCQEAILVGLS